MEGNIRRSHGTQQESNREAKQRLLDNPLVLEEVAFGNIKIDTAREMKNIAKQMTYIALKDEYESVNEYNTCEDDPLPIYFKLLNNLKYIQSSVDESPPTERKNIFGFELIDSAEVDFPQSKTHVNNKIDSNFSDSNSSFILSIKLPSLTNFWQRIITLTVPRIKRLFILSKSNEGNKAKSAESIGSWLDDHGIKSLTINGYYGNQASEKVIVCVKDTLVMTDQLFIYDINGNLESLSKYPGIGTIAYAYLEDGIQFQMEMYPEQNEIKALAFNKRSRQFDNLKFKFTIKDAVTGDMVGARQFIIYTCYRDNEVNLVCLECSTNSLQEAWSLNTHLTAHISMNALYRFGKLLVLVANQNDWKHRTRFSTGLSAFDKTGPVWSLDFDQLDKDEDNFNLVGIANDGHNFFVLNSTYTGCVYMISTDGQVLGSILLQLYLPSRISICKKSKKMVVVQHLAYFLKHNVFLYQLEY